MFASKSAIPWFKIIGEDQNKSRHVQITEPLLR